MSAAFYLGVLVSGQQRELRFEVGCGSLSIFVHSVSVLTECISVLSNRLQCGSHQHYLVQLGLIHSE